MKSSLNEPIINKQLSQQNILFYMESCKTCTVFINLAQKSNILKHFRMICIDGQKEKFKNQGLTKVPTIIIPSINKQFEGNDCLKWLEDMVKVNLNNNFISNQEELIIPDMNLFNSGSRTGTGTGTGTINISNSQHNKFSNLNIPLDKQVSQLSNQLNQLASQINNDVKNNKNQFEINKNNTIKRNTLAVTQPPIINNFQQKQGEILIQNKGQIPIVKPINQLFGYLQSEMSGFSDGYAYINIDNPLPKSFLPPDKDMEIYTAPEGDKIDKKKQDEMIKFIETERSDQQNKFSDTIRELNNRIALGDNNAIPKWLGSNPNL